MPEPSQITPSIESIELARQTTAGLQDQNSTAKASPTASTTATRRQELDPLEVAVVVGSTRQGRFGPVVANWFVSQMDSRSDMTYDLIDLASVDLPLMQGAARGQADSTQYTTRIDRADAFVIVTPEYNHGYPAPLKHAIDSLRDEWRAKPVGFVSYGGTSGGLRAVEQLRQVFAELQAVTIRETVSFYMAHSQFDESGKLSDPARSNAAARRMLDQLAWWGRALRQARRLDAITA